LDIQFKGQMWNSKIEIRYLMQLDVFTFELQQWFEGPKVIISELKNLIIIYIGNIPLIDFDGYHKVMHKHISRLCKFDENMHKFQQWQNVRKSKHNLEVTKVLIIQHNLIVYKVVQCHLHKEHFTFCHNFLS
jgi:hypothetical protein